MNVEKNNQTFARGDYVRCRGLEKPSQRQFNGEIARITEVCRDGMCKVGFGASKIRSGWSHCGHYLNPENLEKLTPRKASLALNSPKPAGARPSSNNKHGSTTQATRPTDGDATRADGIAKLVLISYVHQIE